MPVRWEEKWRHCLPWLNGVILALWRGMKKGSKKDDFVKSNMPLMRLAVPTDALEKAAVCP